MQSLVGMYGNNPFDVSGTGVFVGGHLQTHSVFGFEVYLSAKKIPFHVLTKSERLEKRGFLFPLNTSVCSSIYTLMQKFQSLKSPGCLKMSEVSLKSRLACILKVRL